MLVDLAANGLNYSMETDGERGGKREMEEGGTCTIRKVGTRVEAFFLKIPPTFTGIRRKGENYKENREKTYTHTHTYIYLHRDAQKRRCKNLRKEKG